jgi:ABC-type multidrug transport system ATPase subunit
MSLLELEHVGKVYLRGARKRVALRDVSLRIEAGEHVAVWGQRRSGRSTLLRIAAGVETVEEGVVRFQGRDLHGPGGQELRSGVSYCRKTFSPVDGRYVLDQLVNSQLTCSGSASSARSLAHGALERAGAEGCAGLRASELDGAEAIRVAIARSLTHEPLLLVIDEPTLGVRILERDSILELLHSLAREGIAVLTSAEDTSSLMGADRALGLSDGELIGEQPRSLATVVSLPRSAIG